MVRMPPPLSAKGAKAGSKRMFPPLHPACGKGAAVGGQDNI
jgi:hypothetical protein